ncbi:LCP family protein [Candidatus Solirubrobacter pratensis]|uniref:LCP family protein n=1 Tax=Candidatus Solirubrobacter pratensis TaxID=1298857 RepID=UPI0009DC0F11|nr:LCP family protein [Candidatus Solirubrobacter pratensis]
MRPEWERRQRPPRVGLSVLARAAVASLVIVICSGGAVAAAVLLQVHKIVHPKPLANLPKPEPALKIKVEPVKPGGPRTLLVLGSDRRSKRSADAKVGFEARSDTILLIRLDPKRHRVGVLSIPRDLAVTIPGHGDGIKINEAYTDGGAKLTTETVKNLFESATGRNFPINGVLDVNFKGFQEAVNYVHGVYVDVDRRYYIPPNTGTSAIDLQPGYQRLVGSDALAYVRYRHTDSDLFRAARQQDFLRQAVTQPSVQKLKSIDQASRLLQVLQSYFRFDKDFLSTKNIFGMLKTAVALSNGHAPVNQIPFSGVTDSPDPETDTRLFISQSSLQKLYTQFMTGEGTRNPKPVKKTTRRKTVKASGVSGMENARNLGENLAVLADAKLHFPFYFPAYRTVGSRYDDNGPRIYKLKDGKGKRHEAYRLVIAAGGAGEYYGIQGTTWMSPPFLDNPDRIVTQNGRRLLLYYDGSHLRAVGWKTPKASYWVSNTITHEIANTRMIAIAASLTHLKQ